MSFLLKNTGPRKVPEAKRVKILRPKNLDLLISYISHEASCFSRSKPVPQMKYAKHLYSIATALRKQENKTEIVLSVKQAGNLEVYMHKVSWLNNSWPSLSNTY